MSIQAKIAVKPGTLAETGASSRSRSIETIEFIQLYDEYFARVYNYTCYRCGDPFTADDLTAQTFERALACLKNFDPERGPFAAWLFTIARNVVHNHLRIEKRRNSLSLEVYGDPPDQADLPEESYVKVETQAELLAALSRISERDRDLLSLKFAAGLTNRRIGEITGLTEENVGVILYRALQKLRVVLCEGSK